MFLSLAPARAAEPEADFVPVAIAVFPRVIELTLCQPAGHVVVVQYSDDLVTWWGFHQEEAWSIERHVTLGVPAQCRSTFFRAFSYDIVLRDLNARTP